MEEEKLLKRHDLYDVTLHWRKSLSSNHIWVILNSLVSGDFDLAGTACLVWKRAGNGHRHTYADSPFWSDMVLRKRSHTAHSSHKF